MICRGLRCVGGCIRAKASRSGPFRWLPSGVNEGFWQKCSRVKNCQSGGSGQPTRRVCRLPARDDCRRLAGRLRLGSVVSPLIGPRRGGGSGWRVSGPLRKLMPRSRYSGQRTMAAVSIGMRSKSPQGVLRAVPRPLKVRPTKRRMARSERPMWVVMSGLFSAPLESRTTRIRCLRHVASPAATCCRDSGRSGRFAGPK